MLLLRFHVRNRSSHNISCNSDRVTSVADLATAVAVLKRIEVLSDFPIISVRIDCFVFVKARSRSYVLMLLHDVLWLMLRMILMAIDDDWRCSVILMIVPHVDIRPYRALRVVMLVSPTANNRFTIKIKSNETICKTSCKSQILSAKQFRAKCVNIYNNEQ